MALVIVDKMKCFQTSFHMKICLEPDFIESVFIKD